MQIKTISTIDFSERELATYVNSFDEVFQLSTSVGELRKFYLNTCDSTSYHSVLLDDNNDVVGGCCVVPYLYNGDKNTIIKIGLAVSVFIKKEFRKSPITLLNMYRRLTNLLLQNGIFVVIAVPNSTAYPYWKRIARWNDVGKLNYYVLPLKIGNVLHKAAWLNYLSEIFCTSLVIISLLISSLYNGKQKIAKYRIIESDDFFRHRFYNNYKCVSRKGVTAYWKVYNENGTRTAYLFYAKKAGVMTFKAILQSIIHIINEGNIDVIIFVGKINFFQTVLLKVPKTNEPKYLPLICDFLSNGKEMYPDMLNIKSWDFGLMNYDVR